MHPLSRTPLYKSFPVLCCAVRFCKKSKNQEIKDSLENYMNKSKVKDSELPLLGDS
jgi:hypothetical protein